MRTGLNNRLDREVLTIALYINVTAVEPSNLLSTVIGHQSFLPTESYTQAETLNPNP